MINAKEVLAQRATNKENNVKVQTINGIDKTGLHFNVTSSKGKVYWKPIEQLEQEIRDGRCEMVSDNEYIFKGTDFSKLELAS